MKTAHYTFTTWDNGVMAAGFDSSLEHGRQSALIRRSGEAPRSRAEDKVVDLSAWRAANLDKLQEEPEEPAWEEEPVPPAPRPRKSRRAMLTAELISTLSVVAVAVVLILRVLTF